MATESKDCPACGTRIHIDEHCPKCSTKSHSLDRLVSCVHCRHCGQHNGAQVRCKYPRERQPEVVDMTTMSGWTMASAAEICLKYEAANAGTQRGRDAEATNATETRTRPSLK